MLTLFGCYHCLNFWGQPSWILSFEMNHGMLIHLITMKVCLLILGFLIFRTPLVPVFSFGETDIYDQVFGAEGSFLKRAQHYIRKTIGIAPIILMGRGFFQYSFGIIPLRKPITVVGNYRNSSQ